MPIKLLNTAQVARLVGFKNPSSVRRAVMNNMLQPVRLTGRDLLFDESEVRRWAAAGRPTDPPKK